MVLIGGIHACPYDPIQLGMDTLYTYDVLGCKVYYLICGCIVFGLYSVVYVRLS